MLARIRSINNQSREISLSGETAYPILISSANTLPRRDHSTGFPPSAPDVWGTYPLWWLRPEHKSRKLRLFESEYNTAFMLAPDFTLSSVYHKHQLIPLAKDYLFGAFNRPLVRFCQTLVSSPRALNSPCSNYPREQSSSPQFAVNSFSRFYP